MGQVDYGEIRSRAEKRVKRRQSFLQHLSIYIIVNLFLWAIWAITAGVFQGEPTRSLPWPIFPTLGWGIGVALQGLSVLFDSGMMDVRREIAIEREIQREMELRGIVQDDMKEKPKRDQAMRLSDDGELIPDEEPRRVRRAGRD